MELCSGPRARMEPPEPGLAALSVQAGGHLRGQVEDPVPHVHLAVIGGHDDGGPGRHPVDDCGDHRIAVGQFLFVAVLEAVLVGGAVDAIPVGVDERLTRGEEVDGPVHHVLAIRVADESGRRQVGP